MTTMQTTSLRTKVAGFVLAALTSATILGGTIGAMEASAENVQGDIVTLERLVISAETSQTATRLTHNEDTRLCGRVPPRDRPKKKARRKPGFLLSVRLRSRGELRRRTRRRDTALPAFVGSNHACIDDTLDRRSVRRRARGLRHDDARRHLDPARLRRHAARRGRSWWSASRVTRPCGGCSRTRWSRGSARRDVKAVPSYAQMPAALERESSDRLAAAARQAGARHILSTAVIGHETEVSVTQDPMWMGGMGGYRGWYGGYWGMAYPIRTDVRTYRVYVAQTSLSDAASDRIDWAARTRTTQPSNIEREVASFADLIAKELTKAGLLAAPK